MPVAELARARQSSLMRTSTMTAATIVTGMTNGKGNGERKQPRLKLSRRKYEQELRSLQTSLVDMQAWVKATGSKMVILFEGRDAAGKGGVIHRIMERVSPRVFRHIA